MRYQTIDPRLFITNRHRLFKLLPENSVAILHSNDLMPTNADGTFPFKQNSDLFYLSGIDQEETILVLCKNNELTVHLFIKETNPSIRIWEGKKLSVPDAKDVSGIDNIEWNTNYSAFIAS